MKKSYHFLSPDRLTLLQQRMNEQDPTALAMARALRESGPDCPDARGASLSQLGLAWLEGDRAAAKQAGTRLLQVAASPGSDLGKGMLGLKFALAMDFGRDLWSDAFRHRMLDGAAALAESLTRVGPLNPHIVTNNWYLITHSGCLLACLAADGESGGGRAADLEDLESWALGRFHAFLGHFGNAGLYHEGTGYISYTLSLLLPALVALRNRRGMDLTREFPNLRLSVRSLLTASTLSHDGCSLMMDWNDAGRGAPGLNPVIPGIAVAPPEDQPALRKCFDRQIGVEGPNDWHCPYEGLPLALALYPFDTPAGEPETELPRHLVDTRQGLAFWRDKWSAGPDTLVGWYARTTHATPGHKHDDAGSVRMICRGIPWICGAGQARPDARWQSVLTHARPEDRPDPYPHAHPFTYRMDATGGMAGLDMRHALGAYAERYLAWRTDQGPDLCMAILDLVDEHRDPPCPLTWNLTFPRELEGLINTDGRGFRLCAPGSGGTLHARFLLDAPDALTVENIPESQRTFAGGNTVTFPGDQFISGHFGGRKSLRILVVLAVTPPGTAAPDFAWEDPDLRLGSGRVWRFPFKGAVLKSVRLRTHTPNLQRVPSGEAR